MNEKVHLQKRPQWGEKENTQAVYGSGEGANESSTSSCHKAEVIFQQSHEDLTRKEKGLWAQLQELQLLIGSNDLNAN